MSDTKINSNTEIPNEYALIHEFRFDYLKKQIDRLPLSNGAKVLDVGCFPPVIFNFLLEKCYETFGIASGHEQMADEHIKVLNIETDKFPWKDDTFELAVLTEVIEHLPHNPVTPLKEIERVLKPGGYLVITTPNAAKLQHRLSLLAGKSTSFSVDQLFDVEPHDGSMYHLHNREYTLEELKKVVTKAGLEIKQAEQVCLYPPTRTKVRQESLKNQSIKWAGFAAQQLHNSFKDSLFVLAQKPK